MTHERFSRKVKYFKVFSSISIIKKQYKTQFIDFFYLRSTLTELVVGIHLLVDAGNHL